MVSNPLFHMDDRTDEDYFDKLVEDTLVQLACCIGPVAANLVSG